MLNKTANLGDKTSIEFGVIKNEVEIWNDFNGPHEIINKRVNNPYYIEFVDTVFNDNWRIYMNEEQGRKLAMCLMDLLEN